MREKSRVTECWYLIERKILERERERERGRGSWAAGTESENETEMEQDERRVQKDDA